MNLALLPSDIIRNIVSLRLESLETMRLISPRWNALVMEHIINNRKQLPIISSFSWQIDFRGKVVLELEIPDRFQSFFGVGKWLEYGFRKPQNIAQLYHKVDANCTLISLHDGITRLLNRCSRIENLEIFMNRRETIRAIDGIVVDRLKFMGIRHFNRHVAACILDFIKAGHVSLLELNVSVFYGNVQDVFEGFLSEVVRLVAKVEIILSAPNDSTSITTFNLNVNQLRNSKNYSVVGHKQTIKDRRIVAKISIVARSNQ